jgi:SAM-dependent methyltransferase
MASVKKWDGQRETLDDLSEATHYNEWIYQILRPYVGTRILEIGCGTGNLTGYLQKHGRVLAVDFHSGYLEAAKKNLKGLTGITYKKVNLEKGLTSLRAFHPDTLICVNVLEHLSNDQQVLERCFRLLPPGGRFLLFVPAFQFLFGTMDLSYGHFRRYSLPGLKEKVLRAGFEVEYCRYLNLLGILGWWFNGKILRRKIIPKSQMMLYNHVVRFSSKIERFLPKPIGLSLYCAARKPL